MKVARERQNKRYKPLLRGQRRVDVWRRVTHKWGDPTTWRGLAHDVIEIMPWTYDILTKKTP
jgi:hypothetical protein